MFGLFRKKKSVQDEAIADIEYVLLRSFERIEHAADDPDQMSRRMKIVAALAAMTGALRDTYPNFPIENENIAFALIDANASGHQADSDGLAGAIIDLVKRCPDQRKEKIDTMMWTIAPNMMKR
ncbi:hypothetical protein [Sagittula sp.]|uniref:hypothetical protein n=1 Tax=Sagittula sp. TaxID=2038081 RepID=UPI0035175328